MAGITFKKENKTSDFYIIGDYQITVPKSRQYAHLRYAHKPFMEIIEKEDGELVPFCKITIKNTATKLKSTKRCFQDVDRLLEDLEQDFNGSKKQFHWP